MKFACLKEGATYRNYSGRKFRKVITFGNHKWAKDKEWLVYEDQDGTRHEMTRKAFCSWAKEEVPNAG